MRRVLSLILAFTLLAAIPAHAAFDEAGAASLKKEVNDGLGWRTDLAKSLNSGFMIGGDIAVTPKKDFYEITLPKVSYLLGQSRGAMNVGDVVLHAVPANAGAWQVETTLPSSMALYDASKKQVATITLGTQHVAGTWWPEKGLWSKMDSTVENVTVTGLDQANPFTGKIASIKSAVDFKDNGDNTWSGPVDVNITGVEFNTAGPRPANAAIARVGMHIVYDRLDLARLKTIRETIQAATKGGGAMTKEQEQNFYKAMIATPPISLDNMSSTTTVEKANLHFLLPASPKNPNEKPAARDVGFDTLVLTATGGGATQEKTSLTLKTALKGLSLRGAPKGPFDGAIPSAINTSFTFDNVPVKKISETLLTALQKASALSDQPAQPGQTETPAQLEAKAALAGLPKILQEAGLTLTIADTWIESSALRTDISGKFVADAKSAFGMTGKLDVLLKGCDEFLKSAQGEALQPGSGDMSNLIYFGMLAQAQGRGQLSHAADGKSLRSFSFALGPDGVVMLNGQPLGGARPAPAAPATPVPSSSTPLPATSAPATAPSPTAP